MNRDDDPHREHGAMLGGVALSGAIAINIASDKYAYALAVLEQVSL